MLLLASELRYTCAGKQTTIDFRRNTQTAEVTVSQELSHGRLRVTLHTQKACVVESVKMTFSYPFDSKTRVFLNGYQSWTDSCEHGVFDKMQPLSRVPAQQRKKYLPSQYGDYNFTPCGTKPGQMHGFTYAYFREDKRYTLIGSVSERAGFTIIRTDTQKGVVTVQKECEGLTVSGEYLLFDLCIFRGSEEQVFDAYFAAMEQTRPAAKPMFGYTSRNNNHCQNISQNLMLRNLYAASHCEKKVDVFQIDDGWQSFVGDWLVPHPRKFSNGMEPLARAMVRQGVTPGLWLAPFVCERDSALAREHPDWLLCDACGEPVTGGCDWSGFYALDLESDAVKDYLRQVLHTVTVEWGYKLLKLDFLYAACLLPRGNKTRGQLMCEAMDFLRACADEGGAQILACGVPLGAAFGRVEYCRVGPDVTLDWDGVSRKRTLHRERESTKAALLNALYRRHLNGRAFLNDPGVFVLRKDSNQLTALQKTWLGKIDAVCGGVLVTSDDLGAYHSNQLAALDEMFALRDYRVMSADPVKDKIVVCCEKDGEVHSVVLSLSGKA